MNYFTTPFGSLIGAKVLALSLPDGMILGFILYCLFRIFCFRKRKLFDRFFICLLFIYFGALVALTLNIYYPWAWTYTPQNAASQIQIVEWRPFYRARIILDNCRRVEDYGPFIRLIGGNLIMLMPLGVLTSVLNPRMNFWKMFLLASIVSFSIEGLQLFFNIVSNSQRSVEIDDFILNVSGCMLAYMLYIICRNLIRGIVGLLGLGRPRARRF